MLKSIPPGCYTAIITPFKDETVDHNGLRKLVNFQIQNGIAGILAVGTTGESPTLAWEEHDRIIREISNQAKKKCFRIAGTGSNNTKEALRATQHAVAADVDAVLLVDPYYNGPSSLEIRKEYIKPIAEEFPNIQIVPYVIPGRTGCKLLPEDLAILAKKYANVSCVKEATGDLANMAKIRKLCGNDFVILSGDDNLTFPMMTGKDILANGVISVISNIAPRAVREMVNFSNQEMVYQAHQISEALKPLFDIVTVKTIEPTLYGNVECKARNPLPIKTAMNILGLPAGSCRRPLGKMTLNGFKTVLSALLETWEKNPWILKPIEEFFPEINIGKRLRLPINNFSHLYY